MAEKRFLADMHTHSQYSHDSEAPIEDMCLAQIERGTDAFAVTDHCDILSFSDYDIFTPIRRSCENVLSLREKYRGKCEILTGVEISEGIWRPAENRRIHELFPYDVILGSVHCVERNGDWTAFSRLDFSAFSDEEIRTFLGDYFRDELHLIREMDLDVLCHLTCPVRYIRGKYNREVDLAPFMETIEEILTEVIRRGKALEVNAAGIDHIGETLPGEDVLRLYRSLGGKKITLASDAHQPRRASQHFEEVRGMLKEIGFTHALLFRQRKEEAYPL